MRNTFPLMKLLGSQEVVLAQPTVIVWRGVNIHKSHYNQSVNEHNLDTWHKTHLPQTGENLSLLGHCHKFPEFSLILCVSPKFPEFSLTGKLEIHFQGFQNVTEVKGCAVTVIVFFHEPLKPRVLS